MGIPGRAALEKIRKAAPKEKKVKEKEKAEEEDVGDHPLQHFGSLHHSLFVVVVAVCVCVCA
jgi:hypothetical protein